MQVPTPSEFQEKRSKLGSVPHACEGEKKGSPRIDSWQPGELGKYRGLERCGRVIPKSVRHVKLIGALSSQVPPTLFRAVPAKSNAIKNVNLNAISSEPLTKE